LRCHVSPETEFSIADQRSGHPERKAEGGFPYVERREPAFPPRDLDPATIAMRMDRRDLPRAWPRPDFLAGPKK